MHYDPDIPIQVAADASSYGLGSVLSHVLRDGIEHPIPNVSRTLTPSERNYAAVEKRDLSNCVWGKKIPPIYIWEIYFGN